MSRRIPSIILPIIKLPGSHQISSMSIDFVNKYCFWEYPSTVFAKRFKSNRCRSTLGLLHCLLQLSLLASTHILQLSRHTFDCPAFFAVSTGVASCSASKKSTRPSSTDNSAESALADTLNWVPRIPACAIFVSTRNEDSLPNLRTSKTKSPSSNLSAVRLGLTSFVNSLAFTLFPLKAF